MSKQSLWKLPCNHMISITILYPTKNTQVTYHQYPQHMETDHRKKMRQIMKHIFTNSTTGTQHFPCKEPQRPHAEKLPGLEATTETFSRKHKETLEKHSSEGFQEFSLLFIILVPKFLLMGQWLPSCVCTRVRMHVPVLIVTLSCALLAVFLLLAMFPRLWDP